MEDLIQQFLDARCAGDSDTQKRKLRGVLERAEKRKGLPFVEWTASDYKSFQDNVQADELLGKFTKQAFRVVTQRFFRFFRPEFFPKITLPRPKTDLHRSGAQTGTIEKGSQVVAVADSVIAVGSSSGEAPVRSENQPESRSIETRPYSADYDEMIKQISSASNRHMRQMNYEVITTEDRDPFGRWVNY